MHVRRAVPVAAATIIALIVVSGILHGCFGGSGSAAAPMNPPPPPRADVLTWHNDAARTGQNLNESTLTPTTVNATRFGLKALWPVDGHVDAQPLYVSGVRMADGSMHDVLLVATEHASVYAFDAGSGATLWRTSLLGAGETTSDTRGCGQVTPEIGITSTPVIDRSRGAAGIVYAVAMSKNAAGQYFQRLHALDLASGSEALGGPVAIAASYPGTGDNSVSGRVVFDPAQYEERAALLLLGGIVVTSWTSHCDIRPYTGWVISVDAATLAQRSVLDITPNGEGGASWGAGAGPAADAAGSVYFLAGNGSFDTALNAAGQPALGDYGNAFVKLSTTPGLAIADYFATFDTVAQSAADSDLGSGGALVLPDMKDAGGQTRHLALGAGKDGKIYIVDRDAMGGFDPASNRNYQVVDGALAGGVFGAPAIFNGTLYYGAVGDAIKAFAFANARLVPTPTSQTANTFSYPGATPSVSASGNTGGIVWAVENSSPAVLHAYDATDLARELYNSNQSGTRDQFGAGNKFITPTVVAGKVFVGTPNAVAVFGLLP